MSGLHLIADDRHAGRRDRLLPTLGERLGLAGLHAHLDRVGDAVQVPGAADAFSWDEHDRDDTGWTPAGITTSADARRAEDAHTVLVGWHAADGTARVSAVDRADPSRPRYAHLHLLEPVRRWWRLGVHPRPVQTYVGGLVWWGSTLLVTAARGLRVFDLDDVVRAPDGRLLLPQSGAHRVAATGPARPELCRFLGLDRGDPDQPWLLVGEQAAVGAQVVRFPLDPATGRPQEAACERAEETTTGTVGLRGAARVRGHWILGAGDLSHEPGADLLWTVDAERRVVAVPVPGTHDGPPTDDREAVVEP